MSATAIQLYNNTELPYVVLVSAIRSLGSEQASQGTMTVIRIVTIQVVGGSSVMHMFCKLLA